MADREALVMVGGSFKEVTSSDNLIVGMGIKDHADSYAVLFSSGNYVFGSSPTCSIDSNGNICPRLVSLTWPTGNSAGFMYNDGSGSLAWSSGGSGLPGGASGQVQYNNGSGGFGADIGLSYGSGGLYVGGIGMNGNLYVSDSSGTVNASINSSGTVAASVFSGGSFTGTFSGDGSGLTGLPTTSPGGSGGYVQYNNGSGGFAGDPALYYSGGGLYVGGGGSDGTFYVLNSIGSANTTVNAAGTVTAVVFAGSTFSGGQFNGSFVGDGSGLTNLPSGGGGGSPGGSTGDIQWNYGGSFSANAALNTNGGGELYVGGGGTGGTVYVRDGSGTANATINSSGTVVASAFSGSTFSGSFVGDGSGLTNLPGSAGPGGSSGYVQYNNGSGGFAGDSAFTYSSGILNVGASGTDGYVYVNNSSGGTTVTINSSGTVSAALFQGSGANLTSLPANQLSGTVPDSNLSSNVPLLDADNTFTGLNSIRYFRPTNAQTGTAYTLAATDAGKRVKFTNSASVTATVPPSASVSWTADTEIEMQQDGDGQVTASPGSGVTINSRTSYVSTSARYGLVRLKYEGSDVWTLTGDLGLTIVPFSTLRLDFGTSSSPIQSGATRVTGSTTYADPPGYGWVSAISDVDRGSAGSTTNTSFFEDIVYNSAAFTFKVKVTTGSSIDVRAYCWDPSFSWGNMTVSSDSGGSVTFSQNSQAASGTLTAADHNNDGFVLITFTPSSSYGVCNGLDLAAVGSLPTAWS